MAEDKKINVTVDDLVRHAYLGAAGKEIEKDPRNARYATGALEQYLAGANEEVKRAVEPWVKGLPQAVEANNGILPVLAQNAFTQYYKNSNDQFESAKVLDILDAVKRLGYDGKIPEFTKEYNDKTFKELAEEYKKIESKLRDKKELSENEKKLMSVTLALSLFKDRMYEHAKSKMDDKFVSDQIKSLEEQLKPKEDKK